MEWEVLRALLLSFTVVVAPIWIVMHYRFINRRSEGVSIDDYEKLQVTRIVNSMGARIEALEKILDVETPEWRKKYE